MLWEGALFTPRQKCVPYNLLSTLCNLAQITFAFLRHEPQTFVISIMGQEIAEMQVNVRHWLLAHFFNAKQRKEGQLFSVWYTHEVRLMCRLS